MRSAICNLRSVQQAMQLVTPHKADAASASMPGQPRQLCQVSSKIGVIETLIEKVDKIILGGGMIFTFYKARGLAVGSSLVEEDKLELAKSLEEAAKKKVLLAD